MEDELRPVEVNGHQEYFRGYFHAWCGLSEHPDAIIETASGRIIIRRAEQVTFTDRKESERRERMPGEPCPEERLP